LIFWEEESLNDREKIFEFLFDFNPSAAEKTDQTIEAKVENLLEHPLIGVKRDISWKSANYSRNINDCFLLYRW